MVLIILSSSLICQTPNLPGVFNLVHISTERRLYCSQKYVCLLLHSNYRGFWSAITARMLRNKQFSFCIFPLYCCFLGRFGEKKKENWHTKVFFKYLGLFSVFKVFTQPNSYLVLADFSSSPQSLSPSVLELLLLCPHTFMSTVKYGSCRSSLLISLFSYLTGMLFSVCSLNFCQLLYFLNLLGLVTQFSVLFSMWNHSSGDNI